MYCVALEQAAVTGQPGQRQREHPRHSEGFGVFSGEMDQKGIYSLVEMKASTPTGCLEEHGCVINISAVLTVRGHESS